MNYFMIARIIGYILRAEAALLMPSFFIALHNGEDTVFAFAATAILLLALSSPPFFRKPASKVIYAREGFIIVALSWILMSVFGALPAFLSGHIPSYVDSLFETVSGFTTTGASILIDIEALPMSLLFWRSFTHWVGGMGVLVFVMAIMPLAGARSMHIMRAEAPGPSVGKLVPKIKNTAMILYGIYIVLTAIQVALLLLGGMPLFDSLCHAFGTAGTGGFSIKNASIAHYNSAYIEWIVTVFMLLFSVNFNIYYMLLTRSVVRALKDEEMITFFSIVLLCVGLIALTIAPRADNAALAIRQAFFQVSSIISTTGYATADFNLWPELSRMILVLLMFVGACAGSTGGAIKISRVIIIVRSISCEIKRMLHPRAVNVVKIDCKPVGNEIVRSVYVFFIVYAIIIAFSLLLVSIDDFDTTTTITSVIACIGNIGPGLAAVGPTGNYAAFSAFSKIVLSLDMLFGRLEIFPIIMLVSPSVWRRSLR